MVLHRFSCLLFNFLDVNGTQDGRLGLHVDIHQKLGPFVGMRGLSCHLGLSSVKPGKGKGS